MHLPLALVCPRATSGIEPTACCTRFVNQVLIENKSKFVLVHATSGHKRAVEDILSQPAVQTRLADTKAAEEIRALATFFDMLKKDPERAYYGYNVSSVFEVVWPRCSAGSRIALEHSIVMMSTWLGNYPVLRLAYLARGRSLQYLIVAFDLFRATEVASFPQYPRSVKTCYSTPSQVVSQ